MHSNAYESALRLLGDKVAFLPIASGTKAPPKGQRWQGLSLAEAQRPDYLDNLQEAAAVAAILGPVSGHLVSVDFDIQPAADAFLSLNPALAVTLRTHGRRGCAIWLRMAGEYPAYCNKLKSATGAHLGEWRAGGCYSIIAGQHMSGGSYSVLIDATPLEVDFHSIHWPPDWHGIPVLDAMQNAKQKNVIASAWPSACASAWHSPEGWYPQLTEATGPELDQISWLSEQFVDRHWTPAPGQRNEFISTAIPFLFHAMSARAVMGVVMRYYDNHKDLFHDSREQHQRGALFHLNAVAERYVASLGETERARYTGMRNEKERAAMRICRHLAQHQSKREDCQGDQFVLDYERLGNRLLTDSKDAHRLMHRFQGRIVQLVRNGVKRQPGLPSRACVWRYCLQAE